MSIYLPLNRPDVVSLLRSCHQREAVAQESLYRNYYSFAHNIALGYAADDAGAEDIVQDAFIKLFDYLSGDEFNGDFEKFFRRVIINTGIDHYRARSTRRRLTKLFGRIRHVRNTAPEAMEREDVYRFLQELPPRYRLVFNLYVVEGFSHQEIAKRLGISVGTSKSNLSKARKKLRKMFGPYFYL